MAIGEPEPRLDAPSKVTGAARFPADLGGRDDLVAKVVFSGMPHARMLRMDTREASGTPGVIAILTAEDAVRAFAL